MHQGNLLDIHYDDDRWKQQHRKAMGNAEIRMDTAKTPHPDTDHMGGDDVRLRRLSAWFDFMRQQNVDCVLVSNLITPSEGIHDLDLVINEEQARQIPGLIQEFCNQNQGLQCVQLIQHETNAWFCVLAESCEQGLIWHHFDLCGDVYRRGSCFVRAETLLNNTELLEIHPSIRIPSSASEFYYYLLKRIDKGTLDSEHIAYLNRLWSKAPNGCRELVSNTLPHEIGAPVLTAIESKDWSSIQTRLLSLQQTLRQHFQRQSHHKASWPGTLSRIWQRVTKPTGLVIAFLGPDGCGKSTLIGEVERLLHPAFRNTKVIHLRPRLGMKSGNLKAPVDAPHSLPTYPLHLSIAKLAYLIVDYAVGYWLKIWPLTRRSTLVIFDRYYDDILCDPRRYRYGGPLWLAKLGRWLVPKPDMTFYLSAAPEIIQSRKQEVPLEETRRQVQAYEELAAEQIRQKECVQMVSTTQSIEAATQDIIQKVLATLSKRRENNHGS